MSLVEIEHSNIEISQEIFKDFVDSKEVATEIAATDLVDEKKDMKSEQISKKQEKKSKNYRIATDYQKYISLGYREAEANRMAKNGHTEKELSKKERRELETIALVALGIFDQEQAAKYVKLSHKKTNTKETLILKNLNEYKDKFIKEVNTQQEFNKKALEQLWDKLPIEYKQKVGKPVESEPNVYSMPVGNYISIAKMSEGERNPRQEKIFTLGREVAASYNNINRNDLYRIFEGVNVYGK